MEFNATFIVSAISFILFTFVMNLILYRPLEAIVKEREELINENYNEANKAKDKSQSLLGLVAEKLAKARNDARLIINTKKQEASDTNSKALANAKEENNKFIFDKKNELQNEADNIRGNTDVITTAQLISDKLLKEHYPIGGV